MIAKIGRGADMPGLVRYLFGPGRSDEHHDQRVIAASAGIDVPIGTALDAAARRELAVQLDTPRLVHGTVVTRTVERSAGDTVVKQKVAADVWHLSLSTPPDDRVLSDEEWVGVVRDAMRELGFDDGVKAPAPWVAVGHGRSSAGNDHVHVAVSLVREDGTKASVWRDRVVMSRVCANAERRLGLRVVEGRTAGATPGHGRAEMERAERAGTEPERARLARVVRGCAHASRDEAEFARRLREAGVRCRPRYDKGGTDRVVGYSVAAGGGDKPVWYGGGRLAKDLALPRLRAGWEPVADQRVAWAASSPGREVARLQAATWARAGEETRRLVDQLGAVAGGDRLAWAHAARDGAGVLAAWAQRLEPTRPGALSRAADQLARSAQAAERADPLALPPTARLTGVATVALQAALGRESTAGWLLLAGELVRLVEALERAHTARGELGRAAELAARARGELASWAAGQARPPSGIAQEAVRRSSDRPSPGLAGRELPPGMDSRRDFGR